jgi:capsular exopolysaccharide synthesis family protein
MEPLKDRLSLVEAKRFDVLKETEIYNPEGQQEIVRQRLSKLNEGLNVAQMEVGRLRTVLDKIREIHSRQGDPMAIPELSKDETLQRLAAEKSALERDFEAVKVTYRPGAPRYQEAESKLGSINQRVWDQVGVTLGGLQNQYDLAVNNERSLRQNVQQAENQAFAVGVASSRYDVAKTDAATTKQMYDVIAKTLNEVNVSSQLVANNISLLDRAIPPLYPVAPKKRLNVVLGALVGMLLGIGVAFFLDYLDNSFQRPEDIEQHLQLNTLAVVPRFDAHGGAAVSGAIKEAYQTLRTALIFLSKNRERKIVLLTSTGPQEGKSSTSAHLARTLASAGERVLLVDCDLRRPTQHVHFGLQRDGGLTDYLAAAKPFMNWRANLKPGGSESLVVLTCGPIPPNPPELLGSEGFKTFLDEVRGAFDWIILDSPPAASLSDATLLAGLADLVLLVVRHNHTDRDVVARTVQQLRRVGANLVGVVLNNVDLSGAYSKDYYYAGYYSTNDPPESRRKKPPAGGVGAGARG